MYIDKFCSACFSGYRPEKFPFSLDDKNHIDYLRLESNIQNAIMEALRLGYQTFLCGMAKGFDLLCADILLDIREQRKEYRNISLIAVLPHANHGFADSWGELHRVVKQCANQIVIISPEYTSSCYYQRNRYMIDNSSHLICYWDGQEGGTAQTVRMAKSAGTTIHNTAGVCSPYLRKR